MLNFTRQANPDVVLFNFLKQYKFSFSAEAVAQELNTHPDYPSLLAINDVASNFGLRCAAYQIGKEDLSDVPCPFVAHTNNHGSEFSIVTKIDKEVVSVDTGSGLKKFSLKDFESKFTGTVLVADEDHNIDKQPKSILAKVSDLVHNFLAPVLLSLALLAGLFLYFDRADFISWPVALLLLFKSAGVITSILLLVQSIDQNNPLIQKLCGGSVKSDCNAILTSKAATVFKGLNWSEVGFFYFTGTWLALLLSYNTITTLQILAILNFVGLPYTFYSIYYQAKVAKQWCRLCCAVQALLWLEFAAFFSFFPSLYNFKGFTVPSVNSSVDLFICVALTIAFWLVTKPLLLKVQQSNSFKNQLRKLKYNQAFFDNQLVAQPKYATPDEDWSIVLGNKKSKNIITMVSNPYCPPCAKTHQLLDEWLNKRDDLQVRLVFTANNSDTDIKTPVTRHLMALNTQPEKYRVKKALHDWYEQKQKSYEAWAKIYPVVLDEKEYHKIDKQKTWCETAEIKATPTFLINGYLLPETYQLKDIKYLLN